MTKFRPNRLRFTSQRVLVIGAVIIAVCPGIVDNLQILFVDHGCTPGLFLDRIIFAVVLGITLAIMVKSYTIVSVNSFTYKIIKSHLKLFDKKVFLQKKLFIASRTPEEQNGIRE